jgi:hypothetical protein
MAEQKFTLRKIPNGPELAFTSDLLVGRSVEQGLKLVAGRPSGKHALLSIHGLSVWLHDLESKNATYVNDKRVTSKAKLATNDILRFDIDEYQIQMAFDASFLEQIDGNSDAGITCAVQPPAWIEINRTQNKTRCLTPRALQEERERHRKSAARDDSYEWIDAPLLIFSSNAGEPQLVQLKQTQYWNIGTLEVPQDVISGFRGKACLGSTLKSSRTASAGESSIAGRRMQPW